MLTTTGLVSFAGTNILGSNDNQPIQDVTGVVNIESIEGLSHLKSYGLKGGSNDFLFKREPQTASKADAGWDFVNSLSDTYLFEYTKTSTKGFSGAVTNVITAKDSFEINGNHYVAIGFSNGDLKVFEIDMDETSPNYKNFKVADPKKCNITDKVKSEKYDAACETETKEVSHAFLLDDENIQVGITAIKYVKVNDVVDGNTNKKGYLFIGFTNTKDITSQWLAPVSIIPTWTQSVDRRAGVLVALEVGTKSNNPEKIALGDKTNIKFSDDVGFKINTQNKDYMLGITDIHEIYTPTDDPGKLNKAIIIEGKGKIDHVETGFDMTVQNIGGYPVPVPGEKSISFIKDALTGDNKQRREDVFYGVATFMNKTAQIASSIKGNYDPDSENPFDVSLRTSSLQGTDKYYFGQKDGSIYTVRYDTTLDSDGNGYLTYDDDLGRKTNVALKGSIIYQHFDRTSNIYVAASTAGDLIAIKYDDSGLTNGLHELSHIAYTFNQETSYIKDHPLDNRGNYPISSFSNLGNIYFATSHKQLYKLNTQGDKLSFDRIWNYSAGIFDMHKDVYSMTLSDDKQYLLFGFGSSARVVPIKGNLLTGDIDYALRAIPDITEEDMKNLLDLATKDKYVSEWTDENTMYINKAFVNQELHGTYKPSFKYGISYHYLGCDTDGNFCENGDKRLSPEGVILTKMYDQSSNNETLIKIPKTSVVMLSSGVEYKRSDWDGIPNSYVERNGLEFEYSLASMNDSGVSLAKFIGENSDDNVCGVTNSAIENDEMKVMNKAIGLACNSYMLPFSNIDNEKRSNKLVIKNKVKGGNGKVETESVTYRI
jgi:hypothetical protein